VLRRVDVKGDPGVEESEELAVLQLAVDVEVLGSSQLRCGLCILTPLKPASAKASICSGDDVSSTLICP